MIISLLMKQCAETIQGHKYLSIYPSRVEAKFIVVIIVRRDCLSLVPGNSLLCVRR